MIVLCPREVEAISSRRRHGRAVETLGSDQELSTREIPLSDSPRPWTYLQQNNTSQLLAKDINNIFRDNCENIICLS